MIHKHSSDQAQKDSERAIDSINKAWDDVLYKRQRKNIGYGFVVHPDHEKDLDEFVWAAYQRLMKKFSGYYLKD